MCGLLCGMLKEGKDNTRAGGAGATGGGLAFPAGALAQMLGGELVGRADVVLSDVAGIEHAHAGALTFIRSPKYAARWATSKAGAAVVSRGISVVGHDPAQKALIVVEDADLAMVKLLEVVERMMPRHRPMAGVHPSAVVDPSAQVAGTARVGAQCVIGPGSVVGEGVVLHPRVVLGAMVKIGDGAELHPGVVVYDRCLVGARTIIHANTTIGADGFGYRPDPNGRGLLKIPHVGDVRIGSDVEIGANSAIDRAKFGSTLVGDGTKIDNLCQIAHGVVVGRSVIICGVSGVAGSCRIDDGAIIGGQVGITDNVHIGVGAKIGAMSGVLEDVPPGETWSGLPACPHSQQMRTWAAAKKLPEFLPAIKRLEQPKHASVRGGGGGCVKEG